MRSFGKPGRPTAAVVDAARAADDEAFARAKRNRELLVKLVDLAILRYEALHGPRPVATSVFDTACFAAVVQIEYGLSMAPVATWCQQALASLPGMQKLQGHEWRYGPG